MSQTKQTYVWHQHGPCRPAQALSGPRVSTLRRCGLAGNLINYLSLASFDLHARDFIIFGPTNSFVIVLVVVSSPISLAQVPH